MREHLRDVAKKRAEERQEEMKADAAAAKAKPKPKPPVSPKKEGEEAKKK